MKKICKTVSLLLSLVLVFALLTGCGSSAKDVPVSELSEKVLVALGNPEMTDAGASYVKGYLKKDASELGDYVIMKNVMGTSIDEFGIFKAGTLSTDALKTMIEDYLKLLLDSWMNYQPEEKPKLEGAQIKVVGDYVFYGILDTADWDAASTAFAEALK